LAHASLALERPIRTEVDHARGVGTSVRWRNRKAAPLPNQGLLIVVDETVSDNREDGEKPIWDNQVKSNSTSFATFSDPSDSDYLKVGGHFGAHNIYENRPDQFDSEDLIFATYQNAAVRVYDIRNKLRPVAVDACAPSAKLVDPRPNRPKVRHLADVSVDKDDYHRH
jgi:hypothetical protein